MVWARRCILLALLMVALTTCQTEEDSAPSQGTPTVSGLYGPCGSKDAICADGLSCVPSLADPAVFICTQACEPSPKCPGAVAVGNCLAMLECGQGCCEVTNVWGDSKVTLKCADANTVALQSGGFCQPWP